MDSKNNVERKKENIWTFQEIINQIEAGLSVIREEELVVVQIDDVDYARQLGLK